MNRRTLRLLAIGYLLKTVLIAGVWLVRPDLPGLAVARARATWAQVTAGASAR